MRHVGNGHDQTPTFAFGQRFGKHRIIKIFGSFTVNGHQRNIAQVFALAEIFFDDDFFG